jgi:hypothetical protein
MTSETATEIQPAAATAKHTPRVTFFRILPTARFPQRADRAAAGTLPTRAFRYCEPSVTASAFGYYVFPPITFALRWDGTAVHWRYEGGPDWEQLRVVQFPGFSDKFDEIAPEGCKGFSPPFMGALQEPGLVQFWSGFMARTAPGWSLHIRPLANIPAKAGVEFYEGIVDTDRWFGPLLTNLRLNRTDIAVEFKADFPIFQVQALPRIALEDAGQNDYELVPDATFFSPEDWDGYYDTVVRPNVQEKRPRGQYATAARKRWTTEGNQG